MNEIPEFIKNYLAANPKAGRQKIMKDLGLSESDARFYCKLNKETKQDLKIVGRGIFLPDIHYPEHSQSCINIETEFIKDFQPTHFIFGGDQLHMDTISGWNKGKPKLTESKRLKREYNGFQKDILNNIERILPDKCQKYFVIGNHEYRIDRLIEENTQYEGFIELTNNLDLRDYKIIQFNEMFNIGEMYFTHGWYYNKYFTEKTLRLAHKMLFVGHTHTYQAFTIVTPSRMLPKMCVGIPCSCNTNPSYMINKPNNWVHGFMFWYMFSDGTFSFYTPFIIDGKCCIGGKIYDGTQKM